MQEPEEGQQRPPLPRRTQRSNGHQPLPGDEDRIRGQQEATGQSPTYSTLDDRVVSASSSQQVVEEEEKDSGYVRPTRSGLLYTILFGCIAGALSVLQSIVITLANSGAFEQAARQTEAHGEPASSLALTLVGLACLSWIIDLVLCAAGGYIVGRLTLQRQQGFMSGAIAGALIYIASFIVRYIPNYPGNTSASIAGGGGVVAGGIILSLVFLLIWGFIGGLAGLFGAWFATRRLPERMAV